MPSKNPEVLKRASQRYRERHPEKIRARQTKWYEANKDYYKKYRAENPEKRVAAVMKWQQKNPDKKKIYARTSYRRNKAARDAQNRKWAVENPDKCRRSQIIFHARHPGLRSQYNKKYSSTEKGKVTLVARAARRRASKKLATPRWADEMKIVAIYAEAARLTRETGIQHEVDHIVPLAGQNVCGLHWEGNLQILTKIENQKKAAHFSEDLLSMKAAVVNVSTSPQLSLL